MKKDKYFNRNNHIGNLINSDYYRNLIRLRNVVEVGCDEYFQDFGAPKIDLYLITKGVSSPMGKGSDSKPLPFKFGKNNAYLADSSQFGLEPLVLGSFDMVYCYLPSFRGEDPDETHLNQFFLCEAELKGDYKKAMEIAEGLLKYLIKKVVQFYRKGEFSFKHHNFDDMDYILANKFPQITFDEVEKLFKKHRVSHLIEYQSYGRTISRAGELKVIELVTGNRNFVWITCYDRDTVAFYQKPDPENPDRVLNADLIFPPINGSFGGENVGSGQRQDDPREIIESIERQNIRDSESYKWYLDLRNSPAYKITSGFGLGVERFLAWLLRLQSINDVAVYPVIKDKTELF